MKHVTISEKIQEICFKQLGKHWETHQSRTEDENQASDRWYSWTDFVRGICSIYLLEIYRDFQGAIEYLTRFKAERYKWQLLKISYVRKLIRNITIVVVSIGGKMLRYKHVVTTKQFWTQTVISTFEFHKAFSFFFFFI